MWSNDCFESMRDKIIINKSKTKKTDFIKLIKNETDTFIMEVI